MRIHTRQSLLVSGILAIVLAGIMYSCDDNGGSTEPPVVSAGNDTTVDVNGSLFLRASGSDNDGNIVSWHWIVMLGGNILTEYDTNIATYRAPMTTGDTLVCIASATDDLGGIGFDTMRVALRSWLVSPNGGEVYHVGDTCTIMLTESYETVTLKISTHDGEYLFNVPGVNEQITAGLGSPVSFSVPESLYNSDAQSMISIVSTCCRIRVALYMTPTTFVESDSCFTVLPPRGANQPPVAFAGADTVVLPGSTILLHGSGQDPDGEIINYEWLIDDDSIFTDAANGDTAFQAPQSFDNGIQCILRITDDSGATTLDTMRVIVSWLESPNGGETYRIGDTLHIRLLPCEVQVTLKLVMHYQGDLAEFTLPELDAVQMIWPPSNPVVSVLVRDSLTDRFFGRISLVSDSLRIRVTNYLESGTYVESANTFSIIQ